MPACQGEQRLSTGKADLPSRCRSVSLHLASPWKEGAMRVSLSKVLPTSGFVQKLNEGRELPSLEVFEVRLDRALGNLIQ